MCEREPRILAFQKDVRKMESPKAILEYVSRSWVMQADADTRLCALRIINKHADNMALKQGGPRLDDPIPPARNLFIAARELLAVR